MALRAVREVGRGREAGGDGVRDRALEQAAEQVSTAGAIRLGKRQAEDLAIGAAGEFEAFYAARGHSRSGGNRAADHRGRVSVPGPAGGAAARHREGSEGPGAGRGGKRLAR